MMSFAILLLIQLHLPMVSGKQELKAEKMIACIGQQIGEQTVFSVHDLAAASEHDKEEYFPLKITHSLKQIQRFTFLGIVIEAAYLYVNDEGKIAAIYLLLDNQEVVAKLTLAVGPPAIASGSAVGEDAPLSFYNWDYKTGGINVELNANKLQFVPRIVRDTALVIFFNGNPLSYVTVPDQSK
jgi:hypothetical protein